MQREDQIGEVLVAKLARFNYQFERATVAVKNGIFGGRECADSAMYFRANKSVLVKS